MQSKLSWLPMVATAFMLGACGSESSSKTEADIILTGGIVYTVDDKRTVAEAIAVKDGKILAVGSAVDIATYKGADTDVRDVTGKMVLPGFHDMHIHALGTVQPEACDLASEPTTLDDLVTTIQGCIETYNIAEGDWVPVLQWNPFEGNQPSETYPTIRAALDGASTKHKVFLYGNDGHHGAANSLAFASVSPIMNAESLKTTYAKMADLVAVDSHGEPTGGLSEGAHTFVGQGGRAALAPVPETLMPQVAEMLASRGLTTIQDASVSEEELAAYRWLADNGGMTFRLRAALHYPLQNGHSNEDLANVPNMIQWLKDMRASVEGRPLIEANATKLFADGVMEGNPYGHPPTMPIAAMLRPYLQPIYKINEDTGSADVVGYVDLDSDTCKTVRSVPEEYSSKNAQAAFEHEYGFLPQQCAIWSGTLEHSEELIKAYIQGATDAGFHVHVHALAEKAVRVTAEAFEAAKESADKQNLTQSMAHLQIADFDDLEEIGKLGVYAAYTYHWVLPEPQYEMTVVPFVDKVDGAADLFNPEHDYTKRAYAFKTSLDAGVVPVFGSDAPVDSRDPMPFFNMQQALTRAGEGPYADVVMNPAEKIDIHTAIASYTRNSAALMNHADTLGTLEVGKTADIIVIDQNLVDLAESGRATEIGNTKVLTTIFGGKVIFEAK